MASVYKLEKAFKNLEKAKEMLELLTGDSSVVKTLFPAISAVKEDIVSQRTNVLTDALDALYEKDRQAEKNRTQQALSDLEEGMLLVEQAINALHSTAEEETLLCASDRPNAGGGGVLL